MYEILGATSFDTSVRSVRTSHNYANDMIAIIEAAQFATSKGYAVWCLFRGCTCIYHSVHGIVG